MHFNSVESSWGIFLKQKFIKISVDCKWGTFGDWSPCTVRCNGGIQWRERSVEIQAKNNGKACTGSTIERRSCNDNKCPGI